MDVKEAKRQSKQTQEWASCDPFTLVSAAKQTLYGEIHQGSETVGPLEEVISRFEQQTRASLGASPAGLTTGQ